MKKKIFAVFLCFLITTFLIPLTAFADTGPKPSVTVTFENMDDELCFATLLSEDVSTGPAFAFDPEKGNTYDGDNPEIWEAFVKYTDADGFYYLQRDWQVNETKSMRWGYYPPDTFKVLLYYPESGTFVSSGIYQTYAFDSYYTVDVSAINSSGESTVLNAVKSYDYTYEIISLIARIIITILIETVIALLFGFRNKNQLLLLFAVNTVTQIILNVLLNIENYQSGYYSFVAYYILFEIIVFVTEAVIYAFALRKSDNYRKNKYFYVLYSLVANCISFVCGIFIAKIIPGIF